jgi:glucose/arabinose dehydrogenase
MRIFITLLLISIALVASPKIIAKGKSEGMLYQVETIAQNIDGIPWGMEFIKKDLLFVNLKDGQMFLLDLKSNTKTQVSGMPEKPLAYGQGGLMDVAKSPDFTTDKILYFTYTKNINNQGATTLARAKLNGSKLQNWQDLLITNSTTKTTRHFGSRITFDKNGYLYFGVGDRGERPSAQDLSNHNGSIIRLNLNGKTPSDNPFVANAQAKTEIFSYGHRNPQGLVYDKNRKILWEIEHGPRGGDELNKIKKGKNYGWPIIGYGKEYWAPLHVGEGTHKDGMEQPVKVYTPSIAPSSLMLYSGDAFPKWRGDLFAGALKLLHINRIILDKSGSIVGEERLLGDLELRIRQIAQDKNGYIYFSTDSGEIMRITPTY